MTHQNYSDTVVTLPADGKVTGSVRIIWTGEDTAYSHEGAAKYGDPDHILTYRGKAYRYTVRAIRRNGTYMATPSDKDSYVSVRQDILFNLKEVTAPTIRAAILGAVLDAINGAVTDDLRYDAEYFNALNDESRALDEVEDAREALAKATSELATARNRVQTYAPPSVTGDCVCPLDGTNPRCTYSV